MKAESKYGKTAVCSQYKINVILYCHSPLATLNNFYYSWLRPAFYRSVVQPHF